MSSYGTTGGGKGGSVTGTFWLNKGDVLTYTIGGQNGFNGGGTAHTYGNGGGSTIVSSKELGILLIAGGGGGAGTLEGNPGGSQGSLRTDGKPEGASGSVGGGAGYVGGNNGE